MSKAQRILEGENPRDVLEVGPNPDRELFQLRSIEQTLERIDEVENIEIEDTGLPLKLELELRERPDHILTADPDFARDERGGDDSRLHLWLTDKDGVKVKDQTMRLPDPDRIPVVMEDFVTEWLR